MSEHMSAKKIVLISSVKNECDVIESFCRYNLSFCDCMLIYENRKSSDNTREIIQKLIDEGLPVFFESEEDMNYEAAKNELAKTAVSKYGADLVVQLDADEFLYHTGGINPRAVLENLKDDVEYRVPWRTYIYEGEPKNNCAFVPYNFSQYRNPALEVLQGRGGKALASRYLLTEKKAVFTYGAHWLEYPVEFDKTTEVEAPEKLICAHYPIRMRGQVMCKGIPNFINKWLVPYYCRLPRSDFADFQLGVIFDIIKDSGSISDDEMRDVSFKYSLYNIYNRNRRADIDKMLDDLGDDKVLSGAIDAAFCIEKLTMRYAGICDYEKTFVQATLRILDDTLQHMDAEVKQRDKAANDALAEADKLARENLELKNQRDLLQNQAEHLTRHCEHLRRQLDDVYNSRTWKAGRSLARAAGLLMPWKKT